MVDIWGDNIGSIKADLEGGSNWIKFSDGDSKKLRLLGTLTDGMMIRGWLAFDMDNKPMYKHQRAEIPEEMLGQDQFGQPQKIRPFWAMPVFDWYGGKVALWEVRQLTLQKRLFDLTNPASPNPQFADWRTYDIEVRYSKQQPPNLMWSIQPYQPEPIIEPQLALIKDALAGLNMAVLFDGKDPMEKPQPLQPGQPVNPI